MTMGKPKLSREAAARLDDHARQSADAMRRATAHRRSPNRPAPQQAPQQAPQDHFTGPARARPKSRRGKKAVVIYLSGEAKDLYAKIAADKRMTAQDLGTLAINLMFEHFRHKRIA